MFAYSETMPASCGLPSDGGGHLQQSTAGRYSLGFKEPVLTFVSGLTRNLLGSPEEEHSSWAIGEELVKTMAPKN